MKSLFKGQMILELFKIPIKHQEINRENHIDLNYRQFLKTTLCRFNTLLKPNVKTQIETYLRYGKILFEILNSEDSFLISKIISNLGEELETLPDIKIVEKTEYNNMLLD